MKKLEIDIPLTSVTLKRNLVFLKMQPWCCFRMVAAAVDLAQKQNGCRINSKAKHRHSIVRCANGGGR
jgi:hypothetical protein